MHMLSSERRPLIEDVSDTARWVAYHRALESERPDALFRDPFARRLGGERGRRIAEGMPTLPFAHPGARGLAWALAVRTKVFDELVVESVAQAGADAVLNLAAGLDARPYRLALPPSLVWIEADREPLLREKEAVLAAAKRACVVERIAVDLADERASSALLDRVAARHARVVVVTEGVLVYLEERVVASLADDLGARPAIRRWLVDAITPDAFRQQVRVWGPVLAAGGAAWRFAPAGGLGFFRRHGWSPAATRSCIAEARRLGREDYRHAWLLRAMSAASSRFRERFERSVVYAALERSGSAVGG